LVINTLGGIKKKVITKSLKKTSNVNALDGTKDSIIFDGDDSCLEDTADAKLAGNDSEAEQFNGFYDD
jgi:hypothetical protein